MSSRPSHNQRIPRPASTGQDSRRLRESGASVAAERADVEAADTDFLLHPWLCALQFLGEVRAWERPGIKSIKADRELDRAPGVLGLVTSCKPSGLGDLFLTLMDPTDTIGASVHRKVLSQGNVGQDISVGCVIVLDKVAVFRPSRTSCYLNITKGNVVKVVRNDCDPPFKQEISSGTIESKLPAMRKETQGVEHLENDPLGTSEGTASIFRKMVSRTKHSQVADLHSEGHTENSVCGTVLGVNRSKKVPNNSLSQQLLTPFKGENLDSLHQRQGNSMPMFEIVEAEGSANIMMPAHKEMTVAGASCDHRGKLDSSNSASAHKSSSSTDGHPQQSFNTPNTWSLPILGTNSVIPGDGVCTQAGNNGKLWLPFADEIMLPSSKKPKTNTVLTDCYEATINSSINTKNKYASDMDIEIHDVAEPFHDAKTGTAQRTKEKSPDAAANNGSLLSHSKRVIPVPSVAGWTDEQLSELELFADFGG